MKNRLHLDFSLSTSKERSKFLTEYLESLSFSPNSEELETCANYVLWGKDSDGKNPTQRGEIEIETRHKTWNKRKEEESLDALFETPTFNEQIIIQPTAATYVQKKETFNRKKALKEAPLDLIPQFQFLFKEIDSLELELAFYDLSHGRRKSSPREELLESFSPEEISILEEKSQNLTQFQYLKLRHLLVEKRREQFTLRDSYSAPLQAILPPLQSAPEYIVLGEDIPVYPLGVKYKTNFSEKLFPNLHNIPIYKYTQKDLGEISRFYWEKQSHFTEDKPHFNFKNLEHVYQLFLFFYEVQEGTLEGRLESLGDELLETLEFYIDMADLNEMQREILEYKKNRVTNQDIAATINKKYQKKYTINYISTIFKQQIIKKITEAAALHEAIVENLCYLENFKRCVRCGEIKFKDSRVFMRKSRSSDGFASRCKKCEREIRGGRKE